MEHIPSGMEAFPAADMEQFEYIKKVIDECDYYILIIGARYGSVDAEGISYTEREHDYARQKNKVILSFLHNDLDNIVVGKVDTDPALSEKLREFRSKVSQSKLVKYWNDRSSLQHAIVLALTKAFSMFPAVGWLRGDVVASDDLLHQINKLRNDKENLILEIEAMKALTQPEISDLARLNDMHSFEYTYKTRKDGITQIHRQLFKTSWSEIFSVIAIDLSQPRTASVVSMSLAEHIQQSIQTTKTISVGNMDSAVIKTQLIALGLINANIEEANNGQSYEFLELTSEGKARLFDILAVRIKPEDLL